MVLSVLFCIIACILVVIFYDIGVGSGTLKSVLQDVLNNRNLSFKAKGIYVVLSKQRTLSGMTQYKLTHLSKDGIASVRAGVRELLYHGYLNRIKRSDGRIIWSIKRTNSNSFDRLSPRQQDLARQMLQLLVDNKIVTFVSEFLRNKIAGWVLAGVTLNDLDKFGYDMQARQIVDRPFAYLSAEIDSRFMRK